MLSVLFTLILYIFKIVIQQFLVSFPFRNFKYKKSQIRKQFVKPLDSQITPILSFLNETKVRNK